VKVLVTKASPVTQSALVEEIMRLLSAVSPEDAKGWFSHCGYNGEAQGS
jgi:hypothetical protein